MPSPGYPVVNNISRDWYVCHNSGAGTGTLLLTPAFTPLSLLFSWHLAAVLGPHTAVSLLRALAFCGQQALLTFHVSVRLDGFKEDKPGVL